MESTFCNFLQEVEWFKQAFCQNLCCVVHLFVLCKALGFVLVKQRHQTLFKRYNEGGSATEDRQTDNACLFCMANEKTRRSSKSVDHKLNWSTPGVWPCRKTRFNWNQTKNTCIGIHILTNQVVASCSQTLCIRKSVTCTVTVCLR